MKIRGDIHFTYCSNIHPGESWDETFQALKNNAPMVKERVAPDQAMGIGLRLSARAAEELLGGNNLSEFQYWLSCYNLYVFTINGFPYGGFHNVRVKDDVHRPDWSTPERLMYTRRLIDILSALLPPGMEGSISTSPLSYRPWFRGDLTAIGEVTRVATENLVELAVYLGELERNKGILIHINLEPEPDGLLENSNDVMEYYSHYLLKQGKASFHRRSGMSADEAGKALRRYIRICYDVCHFALAFEEIEDVVSAWNTLGVKIGKVQISAALEARLSGISSDDRQTIDELFLFDEPTYLHQVVMESDKEAEKIHYSDLTATDRSDLTRKSSGRIRVHFHVPVFVSRYGRLFSTQEEIVKTLRYLERAPVAPHWEVETYTWTVLPEDMRSELAVSIAREMRWTLERFAELTSTQS